MVEDVTDLAESRAGMIAMIGNLESCKSELSWLFAYEQDEDRYKGEYILHSPFNEIHIGLQV